MAVPDLKDPLTFGAVALVAAVVLTARRQASRHHAAEHAGRRKAAGLGFFGPFKKKKPVSVKQTAVEREANDLARTAQAAASHGRCSEAANMLRAAREVADTPVIAYAATIHNESCPAYALDGVKRRRRRRRRS